MKIQAEYNKAIMPTFGKVVGYKAGLTNPNVQKAFGVSAPVRGTLMEKMLSDATGQSMEQISRDVDRDKYLTAAQAKEYGLIDDILTSLKELQRP